MAQLVEAIQVRLLQSSFRSMNRTTGTVDMIVKYQARCIETIVTDRGLPIPFLQILRHSLTLTAFGQMSAFVFWRQEDRVSERYRPQQRKKKIMTSQYKLDWYDEKTKHRQERLHSAIPNCSACPLGGMY